jgi:hypothetical protein
MRGKSRLEVRDDLTESLLNLDFPKVLFLESRLKETEYGVWKEYYVLFDLKKIESPEYFKYLFFQINQVFSLIRGYKVDSSGIQELECSNNNYELLIYIIRDGKEKCNRTEFEEIFGEYSN